MKKIQYGKKTDGTNIQENIRICGYIKDDRVSKRLKVATPS